MYLKKLINKGKKSLFILQTVQKFDEFAENALKEGLWNYLLESFYYYYLFLFNKYKKIRRERKNEFILINLLSFRSCFPMESFNIIAKRSNSIISHYYIILCGFHEVTK